MSLSPMENRGEREGPRSVKIKHQGYSQCVNSAGISEGLHV